MNTAWQPAFLAEVCMCLSVVSLACDRVDTDASKAPLAAAGGAEDARPTPQVAPAVAAEPIARDPSRPASRSISELDRIEPMVLGAPPWKREAIATVPISPGPEPPLKQISKQRNAITDDDAWWAGHGVTLPRFISPKRAAAQGVAATLPPDVPEDYRGNGRVEALDGDGHNVFVYGSYGEERYVAVTDDALQIVAFFDFQNWAVAPGTDPAEVDSARQGVHWAVVRDGVLFVATGYNGYSKYSKGKNAYLSAIKLVTGEVLWQSEPLVATALSNFLLRDGWIISGYGFTAEDDALFLIRATDGSVAKRVKLKTGPRALVVKDDRLLVRTYDTNYEFSL